MRLSHAQMLAHWRRAHGYEPDRSDCSVEIFEGMDTTVSMSTEMRQWYLNLLDRGDASLLTLTDVGDRVVSEERGKGLWLLRLPADVRRVVSIDAREFEGPARLIDGTEPSHCLALQGNRYSRGSTRAPVALIHRERGVMTVYCRGAEGLTGLKVMAATDPGEEWYDLDEGALRQLYENGRAAAGSPDRV